MEILTIEEPYVIERIQQQSLDFHSHGVGYFDFTEIQSLDLYEIERLLSIKKQNAILTLYLPRPSLEAFFEMMDVFHQGKSAGAFPHIAGFGLEGPLLASHGGTPEKGVWQPTKKQWRQLAACGKKGLIYVIFSPDVSLVLDLDYSSRWIAEVLLEEGVLPAPGHFTKINPLASAKALQTIFDAVADWGHGVTITDHLFNDMPNNFKHAWRTPEEKTQRDADINCLNLDSWDLDNLDEKMGYVPATIIRNARKGLVKICQNFDGEHVDLAIVKKTMELAGTENILVMTDSIESKRLAGRQLHLKTGSTLLYQDEGIVAAGSQTMAKQIKNMLSIELSIKQIEQICTLTPFQIIKQHHQYIAERGHAEVEYI